MYKTLTRINKSLIGIVKLNNFNKALTSLNQYSKSSHTDPRTITIPKRPIGTENERFPNVIVSKEEFQYVEKILPVDVVPDPPNHESYPTPSGWVPPDIAKSSKLPYFILRTRFHNYPIYVIEREGGSRKLVEIKKIEGDIWQFDKDCRKYIEDCLDKYQNEKLKIYSQVSEVQRRVTIKGHYQEYINKFFLECGF